MSTAITHAPAGAVASPQTLEELVFSKASDPTFDADKLIKLVDLMERTQAQKRKEAFFEALQRVQAKSPRITKNGLMDRGAGKWPHSLPLAARAAARRGRRGRVVIACCPALRLRADAIADQRTAPHRFRPRASRSACRRTARQLRQSRDAAAQ